MRREFSRLVSSAPICWSRSASIFPHRGSASSLDRLDPEVYAASSLFPPTHSMKQNRLRTMKIFPAILGLLAVLLLILTADPTAEEGRKLFGLWHFRHFGPSVALWIAAGAAFAASRSRAALLTYVFTGILAIVTIGLLEIPGLSGWVSYPQLMGNRWSVRIPTLELGTTPTPNLDVHGETFMDTATSWGMTQQPIPFHFRTDHRGFRNPEDLEGADVYLVGDSMVVGALVPFDETVTGRLRSILGRTVMNVAIIATGPEQQQEFFRSANLPVTDHLVLQFVFEGNDLTDTASFRARKAGHGPEPIPLKKRSFSYNLMLALQRWTQPVAGQARTQSCTIADQIYTFGWIAGSHRRFEDQIQPLLSSLSTFGREIEDAGGHYAVVFIPSKLRAMKDFCEWPEETILRDPTHIGPLRDAVLAWGKESGIPVVDLTDALRDATAQGTPPWFWGDTHWNETGHRVAAEVVAASPLIRELLSAPTFVDPSAGASTER